MTNVAEQLNNIQSSLVKVPIKNKGQNKGWENIEKLKNSILSKKLIN
jgi:hypothetical protein